MKYESFYNYFYTSGELNFKISHDDLHDLGNPRYVLFSFDDDNMIFTLIPLQEEDKDIATLHLDDAYYRFVRSETRRFPRGDYGPTIKLKDTFRPVMRMLGIEEGKTHLVPNELMQIEFKGKMVTAMVYFMYNARPEIEEDINELKETVYRWELPFESRRIMRTSEPESNDEENAAFDDSEELSEDFEEFEDIMPDYGYARSIEQAVDENGVFHDPADYPTELDDYDDCDPNDFDPEYLAALEELDDTDDDEMSDEEFCRKMDELLEMQRTLGNIQKPKRYKRDPGRIVGFRLPTGEEYSVPEPDAATIERTDRLCEAMDNMAAANGMTGNQYLTKLQSEILKYFSPEGFDSITDYAERAYAARVRDAFNGHRPDIFKYFIWILTEAQE